MTLNLRDLMNGRTRRVSHVFRFSGMPVERKESVAEHTFYVAFYCYCLSKHLMSTGAAVDLGRVLSRALVHDLDESVTGDIVRGIKYRDPVVQAHWHAMAEEVATELEAGLGIEIMALWRQAKDLSLEGQILTLADLMSVTTYAIEQLRSGNQHMLEVLQDNIQWIQRWVDVPHRAQPLHPEVVRLAHGVMTIATQECAS